MGQGRGKNGGIGSREEGRLGRAQAANADILTYFPGSILCPRFMWSCASDVDEAGLASGPQRTGKGLPQDKGNFFPYPMEAPRAHNLPSHQDMSYSMLTQLQLLMGN